MTAKKKPNEHALAVKAGVQEYWLVDPEKRSIEAYTLRGRVYEPLTLAGERACSKLLEGFCVNLNEIFGER